MKPFFILMIFLFPHVGHAVICSVNPIPPINFGTINPIGSQSATTSGTFNWSCTKELKDTFAGYTLCFNIGQSAVSGTVIPRNMSLTSSATTTLTYQLYQDAAFTKIWTSQFNAGGTFPLINWNDVGIFANISGSMTIYARLNAPQTGAAPGSYTDSYTIATALITINGGIFGAPGTCSTSIAAALPFQVQATVNKQCNVSYANNVNFSSVTARQTNITSFNTLGVACTSNTPYTIGLIPSNSNTAGNGAMKGTGNNTDTVPYQLRSTSGITGTVWGNTAQNTVAGIGTGSTVAYTVYGTVPSANYTPDSYSDTVTINVTY
jgi:spore coat protein U-like protein